ncbi:MAG: 3-mercaptopyruvate sulfurtransferase [Parvularculaceae bacterium]
MTDSSTLVSTDWLADNLGADDLRVIDASWRMPGADAPARAAYEERHIPGAQFFDIDAIADKSIDLPHMTPPPEIFAEAVGRMGVSETDRVVVYDDAGLFSAPRVWWTFRAMGHGPVMVLDGGLEKWLAEDRPVTKEIVAPKPVFYRTRPVKNAACRAADMRLALQRGDTVVLDARPADRFEGRAPEPRAGLRSGHMPGAKNLPAGIVLNENGTMKDAAALKELFANAGIGADTPVVTTCGSGVTAAILSFALDRAGHSRHGLYDGSWAEWGDVRRSLQEFPVATGAV